MYRLVPPKTAFFLWLCCYSVGVYAGLDCGHSGAVKADGSCFVFQWRRLAEMRQNSFAVLCETTTVFAAKPSFLAILHRAMELLSRLCYTLSRRTAPLSGKCGERLVENENY
jgi:hypothetical protein